MQTLAIILIICFVLLVLIFWFEDIPEYEEQPDGTWKQVTPMEETKPETCQHEFDYSKCPKLQMFECDYCELNPKKQDWFKNGKMQLRLKI